LFSLQRYEVLHPDGEFSIFKELLKRFHIPGVIEAGCDEAGRGCLAGPVYAAAVILPEHFENPLLNDSKKLSPPVRMYLRKVIENEALAWAVASVDNVKIDEMNILRASILAMHHALDQLSVIPGHILVDGNRFIPYRDIPHCCMVKGDAIYASVAAASILAKTWRDEYMTWQHTLYSQYKWDKNKGYPTAEHRAAIIKSGVSPLHRKSFSLFGAQLSLNF
jgi:ribonuclease HII